MIGPVPITVVLGAMSSLSSRAVFTDTLHVFTRVVVLVLVYLDRLTAADSPRVFERPVIRGPMIIPMTMARPQQRYDPGGTQRA